MNGCQTQFPRGPHWKKRIPPRARHGEFIDVFLLLHVTFFFNISVAFFLIFVVFVATFFVAFSDICHLFINLLLFRTFLYAFCRIFVETRRTDHVAIQAAAPEGVPAI